MQFNKFFNQHESPVKGGKEVNKPKCIAWQHGSGGILSDREEIREGILNRLCLKSKLGFGVGLGFFPSFKRCFFSDYKALKYPRYENRHVIVCTTS